MATKTIKVDLDAYRLLAAQKRPGESFSAVIKRLFQPPRTAQELLRRLPELALAEDTLDDVEALVAARR